MKHEDRIPAPGQAGRMLISPEGGMAPFFAKLEMADNPSVKGTAWAKPVMDEFLAATGVALPLDANTLYLYQEKYVPFDGAPIRFQTPIALSGFIQLQINDFDPLPILTASGDTISTPLVPGSWVSCILSTSFGTGTAAYVVQGGSTASQTFHLFTDLDDTIICAGRTATPTSTGWNDVVFPFVFPRTPAVLVYCENENTVDAYFYLARTANVTPTGFQYNAQRVTINGSSSTVAAILRPVNFLAYYKGGAASWLFP